MRTPETLTPDPHWQIRVGRDCFRGQARVDVRWWIEDDQGSWRPTRKGLSLRLDEWAVLMPLIEAKCAQEGPD